MVFSGLFFQWIAFLAACYFMAPATPSTSSVMPSAKYVSNSSEDFYGLGLPSKLEVLASRKLLASSSGIFFSKESEYVQPCLLHPTLSKSNNEPDIFANKDVIWIGIPVICFRRYALFGPIFPSYRMFEYFLTIHYLSCFLTWSNWSGWWRFEVPL